MIFGQLIGLLIHMQVLQIPYHIKICSGNNDSLNKSVNLRRLEDTDLQQQFVILSLLLRELKKGETFASLLNIHGRDIRVVVTHLVFYSSSYQHQLIHRKGFISLTIKYLGQNIKFPKQDSQNRLMFLREMNKMIFPKHERMWRKAGRDWSMLLCPE